jgi:hypothetical protein
MRHRWRGVYFKRGADSLILAATIPLGRYTGYRLLELKRFKVLATQGA